MELSSCGAAALLACWATGVRSVVAVGQDSVGRWTAGRVGEALVEAFRTLPHMPVYAPRHAPHLEAVVLGHDQGPLDVLALSERVLGRSSLERRLVLVWARSIATGGDVGGSLREWCRAHGMSRSTFDRRRVRACVQIAAEMNRVGEGALEALERLRAEAPVLADHVDRL